MPNDFHLVTGGAGFIGSNLVRSLLADGIRVRVFDDFSTGRKENLTDVQDDVDLVEGDVRDEDAVARAVDGASVVYHQAALPSVARSVLDPRRTHDVNATGTLNVLAAAREAGVERFVYASSSSAYGDAERLPVVEDLAPRPASPYAVAKLAGEHYCRAFTSSYGFATVALRYFNVFGPRQDPASEYAALIPRFTTAVLRGIAPTIFGDGEQSRDFTFIEDVVRANRLAAAAPEGAWGQVVNIGQGGRTSVNEILGMLERIVPGEHAEPMHAPPRAGETRHSQADIGRARAMIGYQPSVPLEEGLRRTVEWFRPQVEAAHGG